MGRASNHKKARRRATLATSGGAAPTARRMALHLAAEGRRQLRQLVADLAQTRFHQERHERYAEACRAWCEGAEPVPAGMPQWAHGRSGRQFAANPFLSEALDAPCLATAVVPPAVVITDDPAQWHVAANVLTRAVVFDGLDVDHQAVSALLNALAPVAEAELSYSPAAAAWLRSEERQRTQPPPGFPVLDGPVSLLSVYLLGGAARAVTGGEAEELAVLSRALDGIIPGVAGSIVADAVTQNINPLQALAASGVVEPSQVLRVGLTVLSALVGLFEAEADMSTLKVA
jgi:hypothetical protein